MSDIKKEHDNRRKILQKMFESSCKVDPNNYLPNLDEIMESKQSNVEGMSKEAILELIVQECLRFGFMPILTEDKEVSDWIDITVESFAVRQIYAQAFVFSILSLVTETEEIKKKCLDNAIALRKKIQGDLKKYDPEFDRFKVVAKKLSGKIDNTKSTFHYFDLLLDEYHSAYLMAHQDKLDERNDIYLNSLKKRYALKCFPEGYPKYLVVIIMLGMFYIQSHRFKQARHMLSVALELMKKLDGSSMFMKKIQQYYHLSKTVYWSSIYYYSDFTKNGGKTIVINDKLIDFGIPLPNGEDTELPDQLLKHNSEFIDLFYKIQKYETSFLSRPENYQAYQYIKGMAELAKESKN